MCLTPNFADPNKLDHYPTSQCFIHGIEWDRMRVFIRVALVIIAVGIASGAVPQGREREILVKFREGVTPQDRQSLLQKHGMSVVTVFESIRVCVVRLSGSMTVQEAIQILSKESTVEY